MPGYGDAFPKLLLVNLSPAAEPRLLRALHDTGVAATDGDRDRDGQKLFGARIVAGPAAEWDHLSRFVRAIVAFGPAAWSATLDVLACDATDFTPGTIVTAGGDRPVAVLASLPLDDPDLTDTDLTDTLARAQRSAALSWGCGGNGPRVR